MYIVHFRSLATLLCLVFFAGCAKVHADDIAPASSPEMTAPQAVNPVVVELFTSEGCSSCPPADRVLSELKDQAKFASMPAYFLAFHIDYWNSLGWLDRFSNPEFTARQRQYADHLGNSSVYTPQMIVNGQVEFVGSDQSKADREIKSAASHPSTKISAAVVPRKPGDPFVIEATCESASPDLQICAALTEDSLETDVKAGENRGRHLTHEGVVRCFRTQMLAKGINTLTLTPPNGLEERTSSIIVFVQDPATMRILAATAAAPK